MKITKLSRGRKGQKGRPSKYDNELKRKIAKQYLEGNQSLTEIHIEYGISKQDISRWAKRFSCELAEEPTISAMTEQEQKEVNALQKQLEALKKKLEYEQMRNFALETMADLAKTELGIDIRKNFGAKQPKE